LVGLVGLLLPTLMAVRVVSAVDGDATIFVAFGDEATPTREYAEERLGDVYLRKWQGHDGKFFFVQSNDPWLLDPEENAMVLDRPLYRSQRMLYPVLAGGAGLFGPETIVWAMLVVNLLAMGVGTWVTARIAMEMGGSPWWGLAFALNLGFISEVTIGGAGVVAAAAAFGGVLMLMRERLAWGVVLLSLAALSREAMLIAAAGAAVWLWMNRRRGSALVTMVIPVLAVATWAAYLRLRIGNGAVASQVEEIGRPFVGLFNAFGRWLDSPIDMVTGLAIVLLFVLFVRRVLQSKHLVGLAFIGFVLLGVVFTEQVWRSLFDISRAVAPVITSFVLLLVFDSHAKRTPKGDADATVSASLGNGV
jgi:hypothetical protein